MFLFLLVMIIIVFSFVSLLCVYLLTLSRVQSHSSSPFGEKRTLIYSIQPSMNIITRRLHDDSPNQLSLSRTKSPRSSIVTSYDDQQESALLSLRSHSLTHHLSVSNHSHRRQSAIIDPKQMAQIEFSLPLTADSYRRRSIASCHDLTQSKRSTLNSIIQTMKSTNQFLPCLLSFSMHYSPASDLNIHFRSLILPSTIHVQQLTIKVKLVPDGKVKYLHVRQIEENKEIFADDDQEYAVQFSNVPHGKIHEKAILLKVQGKDRAKKTINLGQIGKIHFDQLQGLLERQHLEFIHEVEKIKTVREDRPCPVST